MSASTDTPRRLTVADIAKRYADGQRLPMLTAYDYPTAQILDEAEVPMILVGDSLGQVLLGYESTVRVTMTEMLHHTKAVVRGTKRAMVIGDMPFLTYSSVDEALENAGRFLQEAGAQAVKVEGGVRSGRIIEALVKAGIPVMGHIGWTPQAQLGMGGKVKVLGKDRPQARALLADALAVQEAGAFSIVLELVPAQLAGRDHGAAAHPYHRHRGGSRLQRPGPGHHRPPGPGRLRAAPRPAVRPPARDDRRGGAAPTPPMSTAGTFPGDAETVRMDDAVLDEALGRGANDRRRRRARPRHPGGRHPARPRPLSTALDAAASRVPARARP